MNRLMRVSFFAVGCCILFSGCMQQNKESQADMSGEKSSKGKITVTKNCIQAQAVVTYFLSGDQPYLTDQQHTFCPDSKSLFIQSHEPRGFFTWKWTGGEYSRTPTSTHPADAYWHRPQILAVYAGFLYGGGFLPADALPAEAPTSLEGQRYTPLVLTISGKEIHAYLYRNLDTHTIDRILVEDPAGGQVFMAKCYNWSYYSPKKLMIPRKIDIFDITNGLASKKMIIEVDYKMVP